MTNTMSVFSFIPPLTMPCLAVGAHYSHVLWTRHNKCFIMQFLKMQPLLEQFKDAHEKFHREMHFSGLVPILRSKAPSMPLQQNVWSSTPLLETFLHTPSGKVVFFSSSSNFFPGSTSCGLHALKQGAPQVEEETADTRPGGNWRGVVTASNLQKTKLVENMMENNTGNQESHIFLQCTCEWRSLKACGNWAQPGAPSRRSATWNSTCGQWSEASLWLVYPPCGMVKIVCTKHIMDACSDKRAFYKSGRVPLWATFICTTATWGFVCWGVGQKCSGSKLAHEKEEVATQIRTFSRYLYSLDWITKKRSNAREKSLH